MVCSSKRPKKVTPFKDPCDPDIIFGIPVPLWLNFFLVVALGVSFVAIYKHFYARFKCYAQNVFFFGLLFVILHKSFHSHNVYEKVFCSMMVVGLLSVYEFYLYRRATRQFEWCRFWYGLCFVLMGVAVAVREYQLETTYCHCYYLDVLAAAWSMYFKEFYIIEGWPEPIACQFFQIAEGILLAGLGKGTMTQGLKYLDYLLDPCVNTPIDYMVPID